MLHVVGLRQWVDGLVGEEVGSWQNLETAALGEEEGEHSPAGLSARSNGWV
jgi:hypothetical protein